MNHLGIKLALDLILNHTSVLSPQFQDVLRKGRKSSFIDFFIDWDAFWEGQPDKDKEIEMMFFRKPGLPILAVSCKDGSTIRFWNTFYQQTIFSAPSSEYLKQFLGIDVSDSFDLSCLIKNALDAGALPEEIDFKRFVGYRDRIIAEMKNNCSYLGQMDLNVRSPQVWSFYESTLKRLAEYGASIVRLDAFAYASKIPGRRNFLNEPETWEILERIDGIASPLGLDILPEIHACYGEKAYEKISSYGFLTYDFFLPGLILDAFESQDGSYLKKWADELFEKRIKTVNMLGCHDGIPLLDLKGLLPDSRIEELIGIIVGRGGLIKNLHGQKNIYYQVNSTFYSALGENDRRLVLSRAIQVFMPGKPQVWYLDLFAGKNDLKAAKFGHKEINRTNLGSRDVSEGLKKGIVADQISLLRFRNASKAFAEGAAFSMDSSGTTIKMAWKGSDEQATLTADLATSSFTIESNGEIIVLP